MELIIEYISPYLPYGVEVLDSKNKRWKLTNTNIDFVYAKRWKPILRSMNDISDILEIDGELHFCAQDEFTSYQLREYNDLPDGCLNSILDILPYSSVIDLIKWHYDVFGLIEEGLAVDIKSL